ncbi:hypothetical protein Tco_1333363, partial [Tanacetum coccineum]
MQTDSSREIRTEVDEKQQTNTDSAAERSEQSTESHKYGDKLEQNRQTAADSDRQQTDSDRQQQIQTADQTKPDG